MTDDKFLLPLLPTDVPLSAVMIDARTSFLCLLAQHVHLNERFGKNQWQPYRVTSHEIEGRIYDRYDLWFESSEGETVWFDITESVDWWAPERRGLLK